MHKRRFHKIGLIYFDIAWGGNTAQKKKKIKDRNNNRTNNDTGVDVGDTLVILVPVSVVRKHQNAIKYVQVRNKMKILLTKKKKFGRHCLTV